MLKATKKQQSLYTIILEYYKTKESLIDQITICDSQIESVLSTWYTKIIADGTITNREDQFLFLEEINEEFNRPVIPHGLKNVWFSSILLSNEHWMLNFIKTSTIPELINNSDDKAIVVAPPENLLEVERKYDEYKHQYLALKNKNNKTREINNKRRKVERQMKYWQIKTKFLNKNYNNDPSKFNKNLYTIIFEYAGGTYINQMLIASNNLSLVFAKWGEKILQEFTDTDKHKIISSQVDRLLIMDKVSDPIYEPQPLANFINVWTTYFNLSQGLGDITIIKTSQEETSSLD